MRKTQKVAAIQMQGRVADLRYNIAQAGDLLVKALRNGAQIVALPEFFTTPIILDERLFACSVAESNPALDMLKSLAKEYGAMIGGSYLAMRDGDVFNTYVLVDRDGTVHLHDKDLPTMVESAYYVGGKDDGLAETSHGSIGAAVCWETIRTATVRRLRGKVDLLMTGSHWWSEPGWRFPRRLMDQAHRQNLNIMAAAPSRFSKLIGAPVLHAAHVGTLKGKIALTPSVSVATKTRLMGETQIVDSTGTILARLGIDDGPGVIMAEVALGSVPHSTEPAQDFWSLDLPLMFRLFWSQQNAATRPLYESAKAKGLLSNFDFQSNS
ncbi:MAG: carbon-nitrogen hydrolase family protein [Stagnimonas sp.]|nr:carbon-nitrogen hydrolase family protein [Stagnimonas sp.]